MNAQRWEQIQSAFDACVEMDDVERGNQLTALSTSDPELRAAVEALLAADSDADAHLASLDTVFFAPPALSPDPLGLAGTSVSHFNVGEAIGAGGMGVVYRAEDTLLARAVALKFLLPSHALDTNAKSRFVREAHVVAGLDHKNLCTVHEVGTTDDDRFFIAMPIYAGESLKVRMTRDGPMPVNDAVEIVRQIAEGLQCAHEAGIVHRDLKPGNVMILPDRTVKILDFGLAKARDQSLSEPGSRFGTVSYMSPEQIRGETADVRSDLWAIGVILYEMLTSQKPFGGDQDIAVAHAILHDQPTPIATQRRDVSAALEDLVLRLLAKDPDRRCETASELLSELEQIDVPQGSIDSMRTRFRRARHSISPLQKRMITAFGAIGASGFVLWSATHRDAFTTATSALEEFDLERAEAEFTRATKEKPDDPSSRLWLAQAMMLNGKPASQWKQSVTFASSRRNQLPPADQKRLDALTAFSSEQFPRACETFAQASDAERRTKPDVYVTTVALADCLAEDQAVIPSSESPSGYRFRNSYNRIEALYQAALQQSSAKPAAYAALLPRMQRILPVDKNKSRRGFGTDSRHNLFLSHPMLVGDTVGYIPYPFSTAGAWRREDTDAHDAALARNRTRLRDLSIAWVRIEPRSSDPHAFLGRILETTGELTGGQHAALDEIRAARSLPRGPPGNSAHTFLDDLRLGIAEVRIWLRMGRFDKAGILADSLLTLRIPAELDEHQQSEATETLSAVAALRGRFRMLLGLEKRFAAEYSARLNSGEIVTLPAQLGSDAITLNSYAAFGVEPDSITIIGERITQNIKSLIAPAKAASVRDAILTRPFSLAAPIIGPAPLASLGASNDINVRAIRFLAHNDRQSARRLADSLTALRSAFAPGAVTMDAVYQDAWLHAAVGDSIGAAAFLDNALRGLSVALPSILANPMEAACFVRATILRAELAASMGRDAIAKTRATEAYQLWGRGDPIVTASLGRIAALR